MDLERIKINGRYDFKGNELYLFNSGSGISFKAKGNRFTITLRSLTQPCYYYLIIDRDYENKTKLYVFNQTDFQYSFHDDKEHIIDIVKANEANDNTLVISNLAINGELLEYDHIYDKSVVVYGDSTIAGFGILSHEEALIHTSDGAIDFMFHALYELNYEMDIMCASGYGLSFSAYTNPKTIGIYDFKDKVKVHSDISWENKNKKDILIISLGCNDASYIAENLDNKEELTKMFTKKYQDLIESEIKQNHNIKILMVYGTLLEKQAYYLVEETYEKLKPLYKSLYIHKLNGDNSAVSNHAFFTAHNNMAEELKAVIKVILNQQ